MSTKVYDLIGDTGITVDDGEKLYTTIIPDLKAGKEVRLDFSKVRVLASPFLNAAIGRLLRDFTPDELNKLLHIDHFPPTATAILRRVIENAREYFSDNKTRTFIDSLLNNGTPSSKNE
jgi:hypothetical protein